MTTNETIMNEYDIEKLFNEAIAETNIHRELNVDKSVVSHWKRDRKASFGKQVEVLYKLGRIKITKDEGQGAA